MLDRRSFLSRLALGVAALPAVAKAACAAPTFVLNPAWVDAPYVVSFAMSPRSFERLVPHRYVGEGEFLFDPGSPSSTALRCDSEFRVVDQYVKAGELCARGDLSPASRIGSPVNFEVLEPARGGLDRHVIIRA